MLPMSSARGQLIYFPVVMVFNELARFAVGAHGFIAG